MEHVNSFEFVVARSRVRRVCAVLAILVCVIAAVFVKKEPTPFGISSVDFVVCGAVTMLLAGRYFSIFLNFFGVPGKFLFVLAGVVFIFILVICCILVPLLGSFVFFLVVISLATFDLFTETGRQIKIESAGLRECRMFPFRRTRFIPWRKVEKVSGDEWFIENPLSRHPKHRAWVIVRGDGKCIKIDTSQYPDFGAHFGRVLIITRPFIRAWTLDSINVNGCVKLGSVSVCSDRLSWNRGAAKARRWSFWTNVFLGIMTLSIWLFGYVLFRLVYRVMSIRQTIGFDEISAIDFKAGCLRITYSTAKVLLPNVPNGIVLPEIISELGRS